MTGIMSSTLRASLISLQNSTSLFDQTSVRMGTGRKVNSALDDSSSFFAAQSLSNMAGDLGLLLDNVGQGIQTVKAAQNGLSGISNILKTAEALTLRTIEERKFVPSDTLHNQILGGNPVLYYALDETTGGTAVNQGSGGSALDGTYRNGVTKGAESLYEYGASPSAQFDGVNDYISVPNSSLINLGSVAERTVELVFKADDVGGRQVLYEEGGGTNALNIYIDNGKLYANARDDGDFGPFNFNTDIVAGETYHVAAVYSDADGTFKQYVNGELVGTGAINRPLSNHSGAIGIGRMNSATYFHDGPGTGNGFEFKGKISNVALYNEALDERTMVKHSLAVSAKEIDFQLYNDYKVLLEQIDELVLDAGYRGINLLDSDTLKTSFNKEGSSFLKLKGEDASSKGLYLDDTTYEGEEITRETLASIRRAIDDVRSLSSRMTTNVNVLNNREDFIQNIINNNLEGSDRLTLADMNEESARAIAAQSQQQIASSIMGMAARSHVAVLGVFTLGDRYTAAVTGNGLFTA